MIDVVWKLYALSNDLAAADHEDLQGEFVFRLDLLFADHQKPGSMHRAGVTMNSRNQPTIIPSASGLTNAC